MMNIVHIRIIFTLFLCGWLVAGGLSMETSRVIDFSFTSSSLSALFLNPIFSCIFVSSLSQMYTAAWSLVSMLR